MCWSRAGLRLTASCTYTAADTSYMKKSFILPGPGYIPRLQARCNRAWERTIVLVGVPSCRQRFESLVVLSRQVVHIDKGLQVYVRQRPLRNF